MPTAVSLQSHSQRTAKFHSNRPQKLQRIAGVFDQHLSAFGSSRNVLAERKQKQTLIDIETNLKAMISRTVS